MKKITAAFCALSLLALVLVGWTTGRTEQDTGVPSLVVDVGKNGGQVGYWSASWDGGPEGTSFTACGDFPTSEYAREWLQTFYGQAGDILTLTYTARPEELTVYFHPETPGAERQTLFEGQPRSREVAIPLPDPCTGIWEAYAKWDLGSRGCGSGAAGFRIQEGELELGIPGDPHVEGEAEQGEPDIFLVSGGDGERHSPPDLTLIRGEIATRAWQGSYEWTWRGAETAEGIIACGASPLDAAAQLPALMAGEVELQFGQPEPNRVTVTVYAREDTAMEAGEDVPLNQENGLSVLAEVGKVYVIRAEWTVDNVTGGSGEYAFTVAERPGEGEEPLICGYPLAGGVVKESGEAMTSAWDPGA